MKSILLITFSFLVLAGKGQITDPAIKAGFGVDANLVTNTNGLNLQGTDDWFYNKIPRTGNYIIDTMGAAYMMNRYAVDPDFRKLPFYRSMRVPRFTTVNNRLWIDAIYIRDYNGQSGGDSTAFVISNKNGDSPENWTGGITSVLDKNDIAEMMIHVRREGAEIKDSLWFMGGLSLQGTNGNRYFDFELYQADIFYNRATGQFTNYGPDAGHTSWKFDAEGKVTAPGDVIFTAEYSSSSLTAIEARIWIDRESLNIDPVGFEWVGDFKGAGNGSQFGYANIRPESSGAYYNGLQSEDNTWAGPFGFIDASNNVQTTYKERQFMEFSVNLTKLGLDPMTILGGSSCTFPFQKILVKTRTSTSFSSELKDFIGPFDFFKTPEVQAVAEAPIFCGVMGVSDIMVINPNPSSVYTWSTSNGNIYGNSSGPSITINSPGTYIVTQQLQEGCSPYAFDTVLISFDAACMPMENRLLDFKAELQNSKVQLKWQTNGISNAKYFQIEKSRNGKDYSFLKRVDAIFSNAEISNYNSYDAIQNINDPHVYYRLRIHMLDGSAQYSNSVKVNLAKHSGQIIVSPNPVKDVATLNYFSKEKGEAGVKLYNSSGAVIYMQRVQVQEGINSWNFNCSNWVSGLYIVEMEMKGITIRQKLVKSSH